MNRRNYPPCFYQIMHNHLSPEEFETLRGVGDCSVCTRDDDNIYCKMYTPCHVEYFTVNGCVHIKKIDLEEMVGICDGTVFPDERLSNFNYTEQREEGMSCEDYNE